MNKLKDFKNCEKGHFYPKDKDVCPYCPKGSDDKTDSTKLISDQIEKISPSVSSTNSEDVNKTIVFGESDEKKPTKKTAKFDPNKTIISGTDISRNDDDVNSSSNKIVRRKFRGWLVTFDLKDMEYGVDFKIEEGRNTIGKSSSSDITIDDNEVTSNHALILCKRDKFMLTDELSSNGTFLNGEDLTPKAIYDLKDGDEIKIGHTTLLFKQAFK
jgi:hypothetical protein